MKVSSRLGIVAGILFALAGADAEVRASDFAVGYLQNLTSVTQTGAFGDTTTSALSFTGWQAQSNIRLGRDTSLDFSHREYSIRLGSDSRTSSSKQTRSFRDSSAYFNYGVFGLGLSRSEAPLVTFTDPYSLRWLPLVRWNIELQVSAEVPWKKSAKDKGMQVRIGVSGGMPLMTQSPSGVTLSRASGYKAGLYLGLRKPLSKKNRGARFSIGAQVEGRLESMTFTGQSGTLQGSVKHQVQEITPQLFLRIDF